MNRSSVLPKPLAAGGYHAIYQTYMDCKPQKVCDARGEPVQYRTAELAELAAWRALAAAEERITAIHLQPGQIKPPPDPWSEAGKRAFVECKLREALKEIEA